MRLIDADNLLNVVMPSTILSDFFKQVFRRLVNGEPTAYVGQGAHGKWLFGDVEPAGCTARCSVCGWGVDHADPVLWLEYAGHKYCGNCGAKMDGGEINA